MVDKIPSELILRTFDIGCDDEFMDEELSKPNTAWMFRGSIPKFASRPRRPKPFASSALQVCSHWRTLVYSSGTYWITRVVVNTDANSGLVELLADSKDSDLDIYVNCIDPSQSNEGQPQVINNVLSQHLIPVAHRWRRFSMLNLTSSELSSLVDGLNHSGHGCLPRLAALYFWNTVIEDLPSMPKFNLGFPFLKRLCAPRLRECESLTLSGLESLEVDLGMDKLQISHIHSSFKSSSSTLSRITLKLDGLTFGEEDFIKTRLVLPVLQDLFIESNPLHLIFQILSQVLDLPTLKRLCLKAKSLDSNRILPSLTIPLLEWIDITLESRGLFAALSKICASDLQELICRLIVPIHELELELDEWKDGDTLTLGRPHKLTLMNMPATLAAVLVQSLATAFVSEATLSLLWNENTLSQTLYLPNASTLTLSQAIGLRYVVAPKIKILKMPATFTTSEDEFGHIAREFPLVEDLRLICIPTVENEYILSTSRHWSKIRSLHIFSTPGGEISLLPAGLLTTNGEPLAFPFLRQLSFYFLYAQTRATDTPENEAWWDVSIRDLKILVEQRIANSSALETLSLTHLPQSKADHQWFSTRVPRFCESGNML